MLVPSVYFIWIKSKTKSYHWFFPLIGLSWSTLDYKIGRRNFDWTDTYPIFVARYFPRSYRPLVLLGSLPSIVLSPLARPGTFDPRVCHIRNTGAAISGPSLRNEKFTYFRAHARNTPTCMATNARKSATCPFESREQNVGPRNSSSFYLHRIGDAKNLSFMLALLHAFSTFNSDSGTFASRLLVHGSFRFDDAFTGFTLVLHVSYIHNIYVWPMLSLPLCIYDVARRFIFFFFYCTSKALFIDVYISLLWLNKNNFNGNKFSLVHLMCRS